MAIREIVQVDSMHLPRVGVALVQNARPVEEFGVTVAELVNDLVETMHAHPVCVGLAAPQVGDARQVVVINDSAGKDDPDLVLVNPQLLEATGKRDVKFESCMSIVGWRAKVERRKKIHIMFQDVDGRGQELRAEGFLARIIQHEIDHLNGVLYAHRMIPGASLEKTDLFDQDS